MKIICKGAGDNCPQGLNICCDTCANWDSCPECCEGVRKNEAFMCPDAEVIKDEMIAFQSAVPEAITQVTNLIKAKKALDEEEKKLKQVLVEAMETYGIKSFESDLLKMVYVAPTTRSTLDTTRLKRDHPDIVDEYTKKSMVSASVRVTLKGGDKS